MRIAGLVLALLFVVGCQQTGIDDSGIAPQDSAPEWTAVTVSNGYASVSEQHVTIHDINGQAIAQISANTPQSITWNTTAQELLWVEESEERGNSIQSFSLHSGEREPLYWSRQTPSALSVSQSGRYIAFMEEGNLYVLHPTTDAVYRIAEKVVAAQWSPDEDAVLYTTKEQTDYAIIDTDGSVASTVAVSEAQLYGIEFLDGKNIVALFKPEEEDELRLITIDLRTVSDSTILVWEEELESVTSAYNLYASHNREQLVLSEMTVDGLTTVTLIDLVSTERDTLHTNALVLDWIDARRLALANPSLGQVDGIYDILEKDTILGDALVRVESVSQPLFLYSATE